jgi:hypothetical protein
MWLFHESFSDWRFFSCRRGVTFFGAKKVTKESIPQVARPAASLAPDFFLTGPAYAASRQGRLKNS